MLSFEPKDFGNGALNGKYGKTKGNAFTWIAETLTQHFIQFEAKVFKLGKKKSNLLTWSTCKGVVLSYACDQLANY